MIVYAAFMPFSLLCTLSYASVVVSVVGGGTRKCRCLAVGRGSSVSSFIPSSRRRQSLVVVAFGVGRRWQSAAAPRGSRTNAVSRGVVPSSGTASRHHSGSYRRPD